MMLERRGRFHQFQQKAETFSRWQESDTRRVPDNGMMTHGVLIELGREALRQVWTAASCLTRDECNGWRDGLRGGRSHSLKVSLRADEHHSTAEMRAMRAGEQSERRK